MCEVLGSIPSTHIYQTIISYWTFVYSFPYMRSALKCNDNWAVSWLVLIVSLTQPRVTWEEGTSIEELTQSDWLCLWGIFLTNDRYGREQPTVGGTIPRQVGMDYTTGLGKHEEMEPISTLSSPFLLQVHVWISTLTFLRDRLLPGSWNKPLPLQFAFSCALYHSIRKTEQVGFAN